MASASRRRANRRNAARSTGPRSADGKARASRNARRHGLEAIRFDEAGISTKVQRIRQALCPPGAGLLWRDQATIIAESTVMISRVRAARVAALARAGTEGYEVALEAARRLDRYEQAALARRRRALRILEGLEPEDP